MSDQEAKCVLIAGDLVILVACEQKHGVEELHKVRLRRDSHHKSTRHGHVLVLKHSACQGMTLLAKCSNFAQNAEVKGVSVL